MFQFLGNWRTFTSFHPSSQSSTHTTQHGFSTSSLSHLSFFNSICLITSHTHQVSSHHTFSSSSLNHQVFSSACFHFHLTLSNTSLCTVSFSQTLCSQQQSHSLLSLLNHHTNGFFIIFFIIIAHTFSFWSALKISLTAAFKHRQGIKHTTSPSSITFISQHGTKPANLSIANTSPISIFIAAFSTHLITGIKHQVPFHCALHDPNHFVHFSIIHFTFSSFISSISRGAQSVCTSVTFHHMVTTFISFVWNLVSLALFWDCHFSKSFTGESLLP